MGGGDGSVLRNVQWLSFGLYLLASGIMFAAMAGAAVTLVDSRIERNVEHLDRVDNMLGLHREKIASMLASQAATETAAARLEERIAALVETQRAQGETLQRIESLLQEMARDAYENPRQPR